MQEAAFAALGLTGWTYQRLPVPPHLLAETVRALPAAGFAGANVTIPHKQAALALADTASPTARAIGAANTLTFTPDGIEAENTDAPGLVAALPAAPRTALVLGAGGSARAAAYALRERGAHVRVWNRTPERAEQLARDLDVEATRIQGPADVLVNCTAVGLEDPHASPIDVIVHDVVVDLVYGAHETALIAMAKAAGAATVDGREVLVRQGALSFERWTGQAPPLDVMRAAVARAPGAP
jgi:shikimate dehydrogenase